TASYYSLVWNSLCEARLALVTCLCLTSTEIKVVLQPVTDSRVLVRGTCVMNVDEAAIIMKSQDLGMQTCDPLPKEDGKPKASLGYGARAKPD
ncbi:hypothetical protein STEG23_021520, partial [Scotinomys teguina]